MGILHSFELVIHANKRENNVECCYCPVTYLYYWFCEMKWEKNKLRCIWFVNLSLVFSKVNLRNFSSLLISFFWLTESFGWLQISGLYNRLLSKKSDRVEREIICNQLYREQWIHVCHKWQHHRVIRILLLWPSDTNRKR